MYYISPSASSSTFRWPYIFEPYSLANPIKKLVLYDHWIFSNLIKTMKLFFQTCVINLATMCDRSIKNNMIARETDICIALVNYMNFKFNFPWYGLGTSFKSPHNFAISALGHSVNGSYVHVEKTWGMQSWHMVYFTRKHCCIIVCNSVSTYIQSSITNQKDRQRSSQDNPF